MKQIIYVATGNKSKLANYQLYFSWIDPKIVVKQVPDYIDIEETDTTVAENSALKVKPYIGKYQYPVITNDASLAFDSKVVEIQDPVKVKRNALGDDLESSLPREEIAKRIFNYYRGIAQKYGGRVDCVIIEAFTILYPDGTIKQSEACRDYILVDRDKSEYDLFLPLTNLIISPRTDTFLDEMDPEKDKIDKAVLVEALAELIEPIRGA